MNKPHLNVGNIKYDGNVKLTLTEDILKVQPTRD
jgi:hypothetical protein